MMYYVVAMFKAKIIDTFSSAHSLREYRGDCERLHGHNYKVEVTVSSMDLDPTGLVIDFRELKDMVKSILDGLDHNYLNNIEPFTTINPSAENIARYIYNSLKNILPDRVSIIELAVWENEKCCAIYSEI